MKDMIRLIVNEKQGIKGVDLAVQLAQIIKFDSIREFEKAVEELCEEGEIIEVTYYLPSMPYRMKSIFFPKGTVVLKRLVEEKK